MIAQHERVAIDNLITYYCDDLYNSVDIMEKIAPLLHNGYLDYIDYLSVQALFSNIKLKPKHCHYNFSNIDTQYKSNEQLLNSIIFVVKEKIAYIYYKYYKARNYTIESTRQISLEILEIFESAKKFILDRLPTKYYDMFLSVYQRIRYILNRLWERLINGQVNL